MLSTARTRAPGLTRVSMLLGLLAFASCTPISVDGSNYDVCLDYVPPEMLQDTKHAAPPASAAGNDWVNFGIAEAGQLEKANADKRGSTHILTVCEKKKKEALERATRRNKPWYRKIF